MIWVKKRYTKNIIFNGYTTYYHTFFNLMQIKKPFLPIFFVVILF